MSVELEETMEGVGREGAGKLRVMQVIIQVIEERTGSWIWISTIMDSPVITLS